jgi:hypothetical protein
MSIRGLLFQWASTIQIQLSVLGWYKADFIIISLNINMLSRCHNIAEKAELELNNNHSLTQIWLLFHYLIFKWQFSFIALIIYI